MESAKVFAVEDICSLPVEGVVSLSRRYFNWKDTYQNPLSVMYQKMERIGLARLLLLNAAQSQNFSFFLVAKNNSVPTGSPQIFTANADLKLDVVYTIEGLDESYYSSPYYFDYITFCIKYPMGTPNVDGFIDVFSSEVWFCLGIICVLCSLTLRALSYSVREKRFTVTLPESVSFIYTNFILEGHGIRKPLLAVQVFGIMWVFLTFIVTSQYISVVVSSVLSLDPPENVPESFEDIAAYKMAVKTTKSDYEDVVNLLRNSRSMQLSHLSHALASVPYPKHCMDPVLLEPNYACISKYRLVR